MWVPVVVTWWVMVLSSCSKWLYVAKGSSSGGVCSGGCGLSGRSGETDTEEDGSCRGLVEHMLVMVPMTDMVHVYIKYEEGYMDKIPKEKKENEIIKKMGDKNLNVRKKRNWWKK